MGKYTLLALLVTAEQFRQKPSAHLPQLVEAHLRHLHRLNSSLVGNSHCVQASCEICRGLNIMRESNTLHDQIIPALPAFFGLFPNN